METPKVTIEFEIDVELDEDAVREDRRYTACCPRLPGCRVRAGTEAEALEKIASAIEGWLDAAARIFRDDPDFRRYVEVWFV
jgi:predicted RNase H-like HicB family nuclease